jgi:hypothetical protein
MKKVSSDKETINLLWTGGWDSTFQLLQLLLIYQRQVTPYYLIDAERRSTGVEIQTMRQIKDHLFKEYPFTRKLLRPIRFFSVEDISPDSEITEAYHSILKEKHIGSQYDWFARFCKENELSDMQLSIESDQDPDQPHFHLSKQHFNIDHILSENHDGFQTIYRIDQKYKETNEYILFRYFSFPIIKLTKPQMVTIVNKNGWKEIMDMTWFCHKPTCNMKPCGKCHPCLLVIKEGLGWRIPVNRRIISFFYRTIIWPLKSMLKTMLIKK